VRYFFIADLHLDPEHPSLNQLFQQFTYSLRFQKDSQLYILGDLMAYWIGDDDQSDYAQWLYHTLRTLTSQGIRCFFLPGNRDFLIGSRFARTTGVVQLTDPHRLIINNEALLLTHGDQLCTNDVAYQRFRRRIRHPLVQYWFRCHSLAWRRRQVQHYRRQGQQAVASKSAAIMDVTTDAVHHIMQKYDVQRLIHGHTHLPDDHIVDLPSGQRGWRHVLSSWHDHAGELLIHEAGHWWREQIS
jgi:UDP-2,3-diacylglucosamine hydrolase